MNELNIGGQKYPFKMTMGALLRFKRMTGKEFQELTTADTELVLSLLYCIVASSCSVDGIEFKMDLDTFADQLSMEEFADATGSLFQPVDTEKKSE